jgi:hypothetical protein
VLQLWLEVNCWAMGYANYDERKKAEMKGRIEHAIWGLGEWTKFVGGSTADMHRNSTGGGASESWESAVTREGPATRTNERQWSAPEAMGGGVPGSVVGGEQASQMGWSFGTEGVIHGTSTRLAGHGQLSVADWGSSTKQKKTRSRRGGSISQPPDEIFNPPGGEDFDFDDRVQHTADPYSFAVLDRAVQAIDLSQRQHQRQSARHSQQQPGQHYAPDHSTKNDLSYLAQLQFEAQVREYHGEREREERRARREREMGFYEGAVNTTRKGGQEGAHPGGGGQDGRGRDPNAKVGHEDEPEYLTPNANQTAQLLPQNSERGTAPWILASRKLHAPKKAVDVQFMAHMANLRQQNNGTSSTSSTPQTRESMALLGSPVSIASSAFSQSFSITSPPPAVEFPPTPVFADQIPEGFMRKLESLSVAQTPETSALRKPHPLQNSHLATAMRSPDTIHEVATSSSNSTPRQQPIELLVSTSLVRRGYWNRRGDHLTPEGYLVFPPKSVQYPDELKTYPFENVGYRDHSGLFTAYMKRPELPQSLRKRGNPPERPYESVGFFLKLKNGF